MLLIFFKLVNKLNLKFIKNLKSKIVFILNVIVDCYCWRSNLFIILGE